MEIYKNTSWQMKKIKKLFGKVAKDHGFEYIFGGWVKESDECIVVLDLQKSNFGNIYYLNIKTYIQGVFGNRYFKTKFLVKNDIGDIFTRTPMEYDDIFDLDNQMDPGIRMKKLNSLFSDFIIPDTNKMLTRAGIINLVESGVYILPAIKKELGIKPTWKCIEGFEGFAEYQEIDEWLDEKIRLHEAKEIMPYDSLKNTEDEQSWVMNEEIPQDQDGQKQKPKVRWVENLLMGELWELTEPSETLKGRFTCLGKTPSYLK